MCRKMKNLIQLNLPVGSSIRLNNFILTVQDNGDLLVLHKDTEGTYTDDSKDVKFDTMVIKNQAFNNIEETDKQLWSGIQTCFKSTVGFEFGIFYVPLIQQFNIDSLDIVELEMALEEEFNISDLDFRQNFNINKITPNDIFILIKNKIKEKENKKELENKLFNQMVERVKLF